MNLRVVADQKQIKNGGKCQIECLIFSKPVVLTVLLVLKSHSVLEGHEPAAEQAGSHGMELIQSQ